MNVSDLLNSKSPVKESKKNMAGTKRKISEVESVESQKSKTTIPSVKDLASSEPKLRRESMQSVMLHLQTRSPKTPITPTQALQLWRGFHVALYMHDSKSAISVQNLITQLAGTFETIRSKDADLEADNAESPIDGENDIWNGLDDDDDQHQQTTTEPPSKPSSEVDSCWLSTWSTAFWTTMVREWSSIDSHRMNKYLLLVRTVTREIFTIILSTQITSSLPPEITKSESPDQGDAHRLLTAQMSLMSDYPLGPRDSKIPNGLRLHMLDIYVEELRRAHDDAFGRCEFDLGKQEVDIEDDVRGIIREEMMKPVRRMAEEGLVKTVRVRAREVVQEFEREEEERMEGECEEPGCIRHDH